MKISIDLDKSLEENASIYFNNAKKLRKKISGAKKILDITSQRLKKAEKKNEKKPEKKRISRNKRWFERFRWFMSTDGFLCIGGRDATTNEIIIKKHTSDGDLVFHTDMAGSPFVVIKANKKDIPKTTLEEAAQFTASFSRAWRAGFSSIEVFYVKPEQVTKTAQTGEYLSKGAFMIKGRTTYLKPKLNIAVGMYEDRVMAGPISAVKSHCKDFVEIVQGNDKASDVAKTIKRRIGGDLDEIVRALPSGGCKVKRTNTRNIYK